MSDSLATSDSRSSRETSAEEAQESLPSTSRGRTQVSRKNRTSKSWSRVSFRPINLPKEQAGSSLFAGEKSCLAIGKNPLSRDVHQKTCSLPACILRFFEIDPACQVFCFQHLQRLAIQIPSILVVADLKVDTI